MLASISILVLELPFPSCVVFILWLSYLNPVACVHFEAIRNHKIVVEHAKFKLINIWTIEP
jgi:hypothetical protein